MSWLDNSDVESDSDDQMMDMGGMAIGGYEGGKTDPTLKNLHAILRSGLEKGMTLAKIKTEMRKVKNIPSTSEIYKKVKEAYKDEGQNLSPAKIRTAVINNLLVRLNQKSLSKSGDKNEGVYYQFAEEDLKIKKKKPAKKVAKKPAKKVVGKPAKKVVGKLTELQMKKIKTLAKKLNAKDRKEFLKLLEMIGGFSFSDVWDGVKSVAETAAPFLPLLL